MEVAFSVVFKGHFSAERRWGEAAIGCARRQRGSGTAAGFRKTDVRAMNMMARPERGESLPSVPINKCERIYLKVFLNF